MKQEDKELLLKDLCARLPYEVKAQYNNEIYNIDYISALYEEVKLDIANNYTIGISEVKPYLRPMSSMTDEEMDKLFDILHIDKDGKDEDWIKINDVYGIKFFFPTGKWVEDVADAYDYLNSIHIDYRGLISKGLAMAVTKENNPYKK